MLKQTFTKLLLALTLPLVAGKSDSLSLDKPFQATSFEQLDHVACVTLYHRNGRVGCGTADRNSQKGKLIYHDGSSIYSHDPYIVVLEEYDLTADNIETILNDVSSVRLQGILVLNSTENNDDNIFTSPASKTPGGIGTPSENLYWGNNEYPWNSKGTNLTMQDFYGIPMAYVSKQEVSAYLRSEGQSSSETPIVAEFQYYMGPDRVASPDCLAWRDTGDHQWRPKCLPLGGNSIWASAGSPEEYIAKSDNSEGGRKLEDQADDDDVRPAVMLATNIDSTSLFHDAAPGANSAASNILSLLMAAKLLGSSVTDDILDELPKRILFGFFQGESYGFIGSRAFLRDVVYPGFECPQEYIAPSSFKKGQKVEYACLYPMRPNLEFQNIGEIAGMLTVDQVGIPISGGLLYVHNDGADGSFGTFLANVLKATSTNDYSVAESSAGSNGGDYPYPPTPLTSLMHVTNGNLGGAVLSGYDFSFTKRAPYHSHQNSVLTYAMNMDAIASAATLLARTALAAAYDDGSFDYDTAAAYAADIIPELSSDDTDFEELANCLFEDGYCSLFEKYGDTERSNEAGRTGLDLGSGIPLGTPPNYYVGVYNFYYGQPFVRVGDNNYGAYNGQEYGKQQSDFVGMRPRLLEMAIRGLLNDYLGRGYLSSHGAQECKATADCPNSLSYCNGTAVCAGGGACVCSRSYYHVALDEALEPASGKPTGFFEVSSDDEGISAMYTEPYWSNSVGVRVYRDGGGGTGFIALGLGLVFGAGSFFSIIFLKVSMKKEKLY